MCPKKVHGCPAPQGCDACDEKQEYAGLWFDEELEDGCPKNSCLCVPGWMNEEPDDDSCDPLATKVWRPPVPLSERPITEEDVVEGDLTGGANLYDRRLGQTRWDTQLDADLIIDY
eukprot:Platyproteum_vivax@DN5377_c0_g1_i3.p1